LEKIVVINPKDNVATALSKLNAEITLTLKDGKTLRLKNSIPHGHKFAIRRIEKGKTVVKYGEVIGITKQTIEKGEHVHIHNVESARVKAYRQRSR